MTEIVMTESEVGNRLICKCGCDHFFIQKETDISNELSTIECITCHQIYNLSIPAELSGTAEARRQAREG